MSGLSGALFALLATAPVAGCDHDAKSALTVIEGSSPPLEFADMTRASDGKAVTEADYRGKVVMLYFGYTFCRRMLPTTLANVKRDFGRVGAEAQQIPKSCRVTVTRIASRHASNSQGLHKELRPSRSRLCAARPISLARLLARRYRVVYSVTPATKDGACTRVTHSSAIDVFRQVGRVGRIAPPCDCLERRYCRRTADLERLAEDKPQPGLVARLWRLI